MWRLLPLAFLLAACSLESVPMAGGLSPGGSVELTLPAAQEVGGGELRPSSRVYHILIPQLGAYRLSAVSEGLKGKSRLRLILYDNQGEVKAQSVARHWFGIPQVALASMRPQGIKVTGDPGYRLNFRAQAGEAFYIRVENLAEDQDKVRLSLEGFSPNLAGNRTPLEEFSSGTKEGAIEFLDDVDVYDVSEARGYLRFSYSGPLDLVALLYSAPDDRYPIRLDPVVSCAPVSPAVLLVVRDRGMARAGFDKEGSGRYTLTIDGTSCQP
ncbi:MAG: hypothetical protein ACUVUP_05450 [Thermaceae bacterium]